MADGGGWGRAGAQLDQSTPAGWQAAKQRQI
jgi:hypothetical protein